MSLTSHLSPLICSPLVCSSDLGLSWQRQDQILTVGTKPSQPQFAGIGDFDVVWDWQQRRWFMVTSGMRGAASYDPSAAASTWKKWDGRDFTRENFLAESEKFTDVNNQSLPNGEHPAIHWNRFLKQWVMVWNSYDGDILITSARRLPEFEPPRILVAKETEEQKQWYPTLISDTLGDRLAETKLHLYWRDFATGIGHGQSYFRKVELELFQEQIP